METMGQGEDLWDIRRPFETKGIATGSPSPSPQGLLPDSEPQGPAPPEASAWGPPQEFVDTSGPEDRRTGPPPRPCRGCPRVRGTRRARRGTRRTPRRMRSADAPKA